MPSDVSLDLFWPRDVVGRTITAHEADGSGGCRCGEGFRDGHAAHVMWALLDAVEAHKQALNAPQSDETPVRDPSTPWWKQPWPTATGDSR